LLFKNKKTEIKPPLQKGESFISGLFQKNQADSDNDGLQDWEETLWKTDKNNPDTDGDGTLDGEEIKLKRDPLIAGPNDLLENKSSAPQSVQGDNRPLTETEIFARQFITGYLNLKQSGELNEETKKQLTNNLFENLQKSQDYDYKTYKISDIKISQDNSPEMVRQYGNDMGRILENFNNIKENEFEILTKAIEENNSEKLTELQLYIEDYQRTADDLLKTRCPSNYSQMHIDLVNSFMATEYSVSEMQKFFIDPLKAFHVIGLYFEQGRKMKEIFSNLGVEFKKMGISFEQNEPGFTLLQYF